MFQQNIPYHKINNNTTIIKMTENSADIKREVEQLQEELAKKEMEYHSITDPSGLSNALDHMEMMSRDIDRGLQNAGISDDFHGFSEEELERYADLEYQLQETVSELIAFIKAKREKSKEKISHVTGEMRELKKAIAERKKGETMKYFLGFFGFGKPEE